MVAEQFRWFDGLARAKEPPIVARITKSGVRFWDEGEWIAVRVKHLRRRKGK